MPTILTVIDEPFKELIDPLIEKIVENKKAFETQFGDSSFKDFRWQAVLEGHLFEQLYTLSSHATAEQIGEYVIEFFNSYDDDRF